MNPDEEGEHNMHEQVIKALEDKVVSLHEEDRIYCDHDETEEVAFALDA